MILINDIQQKIKQPLPGREAQLNMAPGLRRHFVETPDDATVACVMLLLYHKDEDWYFVLIQRMTHEKDRHSGQISFPGGRVEQSDISLEACALRETEEEIGVPQSDIQMLGRLSELYIPVSNYLVHPFVGFLENEPQFIPQLTEVKEILEIPVSKLIDIENKKKIDMRGGRNIVLKNVPYFDFFGNVVWGATAMMLSEFEYLLSDSKL